MHAPIRRVFLPLLLSTLWAVTGAQAEEVAEDSQQLPPPPGPYVSSRPDLQAMSPPQNSTNRLPFVGNMPAPSMPMRYMPPPRQFPAAPPWQHGPMGR